MEESADVILGLSRY